MTDIDREERIRIRAHEIWERGGRREGEEKENWEQARREIEMEEEDAAGLKDAVTETIGLAVGQEPDEPQPGAQHSQEPAEGSRETVKKPLAEEEAGGEGKKGRGE